MSRSTPLEALPESREINDGLVENILEDYDNSMPAPRPQGRQPNGPTDEFYYDEEYVPPPRPMRVIQQEDWKDYLLREGKIPLIAAIIFILLNLEFVDEQLIKYIPRLFNRDNELTFTGIVVKAGLLAAGLMLVKRFLL